MEGRLYRSVSHEYVQPDLPTVPSACLQREWEKVILSRRRFDGGHYTDVGRNLHCPGSTAISIGRFRDRQLDEILEKAHSPRHIDFMSIDIEGAEYEALRGLSLDKYEVQAFVIKHNFEEPKRHLI